MDAANDSLGSQGLTARDREVGSDEFIVALAPIRLIAAGGFLAVTYLRSRESTGDIDYLIDPEFAGDQHIQVPLQKAIRSVAHQKGFTNKWINEDMAIFVTKKARQTLFGKAEKQNIVLFSGENIEALKLRNKGPLDQESVRRMNMNGFDVLPSYETMQRVSREYQQKYNEDIFK
ncbi:uncharacterized protein BO66DRAFT_413705 [Aspergillus aculeatinus CBS 121060]|uniref:Uncharacterized protein n=1 Tax=Aspergillus aculeatinus CBS 121060 TaxID=1448322 RepID=A0ACD1H1F8_9EURO|nr:hypothetical protein BO66DRAFT_413705 [Aspergillus aculeatinus CBS 121060]RAH67334.1 hypothetical protein BO66DRAFT_413705 [Aspergillus aculeatinus CBS 121060]